MDAWIRWLDEHPEDVIYWEQWLGSAWNFSPGRGTALMQRNVLEYLEATAPRLPDKVAFSNGADA